MTGYAPKYIKNMRSSKTGPPYQTVGRDVIYRESDVKEWFEQHKKRAAFQKGEDMPPSNMVPIPSHELYAAVEHFQKVCKAQSIPVTVDGQNGLLGSLVDMFDAAVRRMLSAQQGLPVHVEMVPAAAQEELDKLKAELEETKKKHGHVTAAQNKLRTEYNELERSKNELAKMSAGFEDEAIELRKQVKELGEALADVRRRALVCERCSKIEQDNKKLEEERDELRKIGLEAQDILNAEIDIVKAERDELQKQLRQVEISYAKLSGEYNDLRNGFDEDAAENLRRKIEEDLVEQYDASQLNDQGVLELARMQGEVRALERLLDKQIGGAR